LRSQGLGRKDTVARVYVIKAMTYTLPIIINIYIQAIESLSLSQSTRSRHSKAALANSADSADSGSTRDKRIIRDSLKESQRILSTMYSKAFELDIDLHYSQEINPVETYIS
jgi:hypothetical protein